MRLTSFFLASLAFADAAVVSASSLAPRPVSRPATRASISADDLRQRLYLIADDSMMGSQPGDAGNYKTADYVSKFKRLGLEQAGENGSYFQTVPFVLMAPDPATYLETGGTRFTLGSNVVVVGQPTTVRAIDNLPVVYGGPATDPTQ